MLGATMEPSRGGRLKQSPVLGRRVDAYAGCRVVYAVGTMPAAGWLFADRDLPRFLTQAARWRAAATGTDGMILATPRQGRFGASDRTTLWCELVGRSSCWAGHAAMFARRSKHSPAFSMACMTTESLRATAMAARLKPTFSRSLIPQRRKSLSAWARVRMTVAAS